MSDMIERVAGAIADLIGERPVPWGLAWEGVDGFREVAKAAIAAMREPTDAMVKAAVDRDEDGSPVDPSVPCSHEEAWRAMVDEALKP